MRQALHIFQKDLRCHWYEIAITIIVTMAFAVAGAFERRLDLFWLDSLETLFAFFLVLTWWNLTVRVIQGEALPGDWQFWLTRPYRRGSLVAAKALLIVLCVNLPMLVADIVIVTANGFPVAFAALAWRQVLLTVTFVLPVIAIAALTTVFSQFVWAAILLLVTLLGGFAFAGDWWALSWILIDGVLLATTLVSLAIVGWQYTRRRTAAARAFGVGATVLIVIGMAVTPWKAGFWLQSKLSPEIVDGAVIRVGYSGNGPQHDRSALPTIALNITGIPTGMSVQADLWAATFSASDGTTWREASQAWNLSPYPGAWLRPSNKAVWKVLDLPVTVRGTLYLTLLAKDESVHLLFGNSVAVGSGRCTAMTRLGQPNDAVLCTFPFHTPSDLIWTEARDRGKTVYSPGSPLQMASYSPFPADAGIRPLNRGLSYTSGQQPISAIDLHTMKPLAYIERDFEFRDLRLADFQ